ncbi:hypothetical protein ACIOWI_11620 [Streptomyces sp. NPDC087659]|uniref:hypothetical protein n=1 Tax=Streptomyces sp. NPDC087659 TaxID=3365801 RepID=UPI003828EA97
MIGTATATFLVRLVTTGRLCGAGPGSALAEVGAAVRGPFVDDVDAAGQCLRRDHGVVEFRFNAEGAQWVMSGMTLQLHRLAGNPGLARRWRDAVGVALPPTVAWPDSARVVDRRARCRVRGGRGPGAREHPTGATAVTRHPGRRA